MDRDALAHRDVADDFVTGDGGAALGQPDEHILDALDPDPEIATGDRAAALRGLERDRLFLGDLLRLQPVQDLVDDLADRHLARAQSDVEVLGFLEAGLANHLGENGGADELLVGKTLLLEPLLERVAALLLGLLTRLARVPLADFVAGA